MSGGLRIQSVSIYVGEVRKTVLITKNGVSTFYHGSYDDIRAHAREIIAQADYYENLEGTTHEALAEPRQLGDR